MDCLFCKIIKKEIPGYILYEDEQVLSFLDINPVNKGHALVIPKEHFDRFSNTSSHIWNALMSTAQKVAISVCKGVNAPAFNIHINNGSIAGQQVFHLHLHIIPRFENDDVKMWKGNSYEDGEIEKIQQKVTTLLTE